MSYKSKLDIPFQIKSNKATYKEIDNQNRTIKAIANTYNFFDYDFDVLVLGCAERSIKERGSNSQANDKILHALFHDLTRLPGKSIVEAETEVEGNPVLYVESYLPETQDGEDTLIKYNEGIYNQHSIGFRYMNLEYIEQGSDEWDRVISTLINPDDAEKVGFLYLVKEINLFEWSTVAFGANKLTQFLGTKTTNKAIHLQTIYKKLDAMIEKAKRFEVKNKKVFDLQISQLKQMISEITIEEPFGNGFKSPGPDPQRFDLNNIVTNLNL